MGDFYSSVNNAAASKEKSLFPPLQCTASSKERPGSEGKGQYGSGQEAWGEEEVTLKCILILIMLLLT